MSELASESVTQRVPLDTEIELPTAADTEALGERLADGLGAGDLVVLTGPLGAGKTVLVRGLARGLGVTGAVTSPTFVIAREHRAGRDGGVPLVHVDAYRLGGPAELPEARLVRFDGVGHLPMLERADAMNAALADLLRRCAARGRGSLRRLRKRA